MVAPIEKSEALIKRGLDLRIAGDDQAALKVLGEAYDTARTPRTAVQLGLCELALNRWVAAEAHLSEGLRVASDPFIRRNRATITRSLATAKGHLGHLELTGRPAGAEVEVDGRVIGVLPLADAVRLAEGTAHVRLAAKGYKTMRQAVTIKARELARLTVELELARAPVLQPAASSSEERLSAENRSSVDAQRPGPAPAISPPRSSWRRPAAWVVTGLAVASLGAGGISLGVYSSKSRQFNDVRDAPLTADGRCYEPAPERGGGRCQALWEQGRSALRWGIAGLAVGGAAIAGAFVLFAKSAPADDRRLACAPANIALDSSSDRRVPDVGALLMCAGRF